MKYAIIAAGEGSRLMQEGVQLPKPLVRVGGEHLVDRLIRIFLANKADEIVVICNEQMTDVAAHLKDVQRNGLAGKSVPLRLIVKRTPSSMHSLYELSPYLHASPFVLTTVDTVFKEDEFALFVNSMNTALEAGDNGMMAVTDFVDDGWHLWLNSPMLACVEGLHWAWRKPYAQFPAGIDCQWSEIKGLCYGQSVRRRPRFRHQQSGEIPL